MNALRTSASTRIAGFVFAVFASVATLGATVGGMQANDAASTPLMALDQVTVSAVKAY